MAKSSGETKTPIIVALAFFVLATLVLGVLTYMAHDENAKQVETVTEAEKKAAAALQLQAQAQEKLLVYKVALGVNSADEFEELQNARDKEKAHEAFVALKNEVNQALTTGTPTAKGLIAQESENLIAQKNAAGIDPNTAINIGVRADNILDWSWPTADAMQKPQRSILGTTVKAVGSQEIAIAKSNRSTELNALARKDYDEKAAAYEAQKNASIKQAQDNNTAFEAKQKELDAKYQERVKVFQNLELEFAKARTALSELANEKDIQTTEARRRLAGVQATLSKLEGDLDARTDPFSFDKPHGEITGISSNLVTIDIGSAANVHAGLTFSVQPADTPTVGLQARMKPKRDAQGRPMYNGQTPEMEVIPKGTIEVTRVLGPNLSQARITSEPDPIRDGILKGDVLYNAAWQPGAADNIALFGLFDVDADGIDDTKRVVRDLEKMGINVNAYYDLDQKKWVGKLTERTYYVVEGYYPSQTGGGDETIRNAKAQLTAALLAARTEAREKGGKIVKIRDFFPRIGYDINLDISDSKINQAYLPYLRGNAPAANADNGFGN